ncbi:MAG: ABC transporter ATP-binding protein [Chloroflexota bacterium]
MITAEGLTKQFDDFLAVDDVSLQVGAGEVLALLGPNGAGKTTTVRMLTSVLRPTRGNASIAGYDVVKYPAKVRGSVGVLTEQHGLYGRMNALDYLDFFGQLYRMPEALRKQRIHELLEQYGLLEFSKRQIGDYSKGMRQKLALARAILHDPPVLLLDEPTSAMDPESARLVRDALHQLSSANRAIILCTHNLAEAEELSDQIAIIRRGRIIAQGTSQTLKRALLGPEEYEVRLATTLNGQALDLPAEVTLTERNATGFRFHSPSPERDNPLVMAHLVAQSLPVVSLHPVPRSLEQVYLQAVQASAEVPLEVAHVA